MDSDNIILNEGLVINALKTSHMLKESVIFIYGVFEKKYEKRIIDFCKKYNIDWKSILIPKEEVHYYCLFCGKEIFGKERSRKKFCNSSCAAKYNNKGRTHSLESRLKVSKTLSDKYWTTHDKKEKSRKELYAEERKKKCHSMFNRNKEYFCSNCGKKIEKVACSKENLYCSHKCQVEYKHKEYIKKWQNGEVDGVTGKYCMSDHVRNYMLEKAEYKCSKCGWGEVNEYTGNVPLQIHHIDGDCTNNKEENLQVLCPNCHSLTENFGSRNKNATVGRTDYYTSKYRELKYDKTYKEE